MQQLIRRIVSDPKIAASSNFSDKVYRDEPILITAPQMEKYTPPKIREMRTIRRGDPFAERVFYEQGKFMESFEDDFDYRGDFSRYFPTYQAMTDAQLRGYFSWRTRVRSGFVEKTSLSFAFVYIYELLNQIGVPSPEEGFHGLKNFWSAYREFDPRIDDYARLWLKDYVVYHNLDKSLLEGFSDIEFDNAVLVLLGYKSRGPEEVFSALNALSSYNLEESKFFKLHPDVMKEVVHGVFSTISEYYNKTPRKSAREKLFGRVCVSAYTMFKSAVFLPRARRRYFVYQMGNCHRYICEDGNWSCERFIWYGRNNKQIGALLKTIDYIMRQKCGYKSTLQPGKTNKTLNGKIEKEIARHVQEKQADTAPRIDIDVSKLRDIRAAALATQNRLLVEEPENEEPLAAAHGKAGQGRDMGLSDVECRFMHCLIYGEEYDELIRSHGLLLSVLIDGVNEKLFSAFNDTVIVETGNGPELIEEYAEELKGLIAQ